MKFVPKKTKEKEPSSYKTLYLKESLVKEIEKITKENDTSFNNVIVSKLSLPINVCKKSYSTSSLQAPLTNLFKLFEL